MSPPKFFVLATLALCAGQAGATGTFVAASGARDMTYDAQRGIAYITAGSQVLRYKVASSTFLAPILFDAVRNGVHSLNGIDLSPDGKTLAVTDSLVTQSGSVIHLVDLATLIDHKYAFAQDPRAPYENGTWAAAYAANGNLYVTERVIGSASAPMRKYTAATKTWSVAYFPSQDSMVSPTGDGKVIAFAEANNSLGPWGFIDDATTQVSTSDASFAGTNWFNYEIAANSNGTQFVVPTIGGGYVYDNNFRKVKVLGAYFEGQPSGVAYDPVRPIAYMPWAGTSDVMVYDMAKIQQIDTLDFGKPFHFGDAFVSGRTRISRDGSLLMVQVTGGVQIDRLYAPLSAANANASVTAGTPVTIPVSAMLGVAGDISFGVAKKPAHGKATVNGNTVVYTPDYSFSGTETFTYQAHYGQAAANGTITVAVAPSPNHSPVAFNDIVKLTEPKTVLIDALANDSDADGDRLAITVATNTLGGKGIVSIHNNKILYTPPPLANSTSSITYTISDGHGGTAQAHVSVRVNPTQ